MSKRNRGQFGVAKDVVKNAADNALTMTAEKRQTFFEEEVDKVMCRRFFKPADREHASAIVMRDADGLERWQMYGWGTINMAEALLAACRVCCEQVVFLTTEEAAFVDRWSFT